MELSQSYDRDYEFCGLVVLTWVIFFIIFFLNFILKHWVDWELTFIISFWFTFIGLSQSHNLGHEFFRLARLTQIFVCCFFNWIFVFKFLPSIFGWLIIEIYNLFLFNFNEFISIYWPDFDRLTRVDSGHFLSFFIWILFVFFLVFFLSKSSFNIELIGIKFHNLYQFVFYEVLIVSRSKSWVWSVDSCSFLSSFFHWFSFNFIHQYWTDWKLSFIIYFDLFLMSLSQSHDLDLIG
jgi:hypothetical protein